MRANQFVSEIDYSAGVGDLPVPNDQIIRSSSVVGDIDGEDVYLFTSDDQEMYYFGNDQAIFAFIVVINNSLRAVRNLSNKPGLVTALVVFVVHQLKKPLTIDASEPLTPEGFRWLTGLIRKGGRGLTIRANGSLVDLDALESEWNHAMRSPSPGPTSITLESHMTRVLHSKKAGLLQPAMLYIGDQGLL